jgi:hypothetical protein
MVLGRQDGNGGIRRISRRAAAIDPKLPALNAATIGLPVVRCTLAVVA